MRLIWDAHLKADFILIAIPIITFPSFAQQVILTDASWVFSHCENHLDPELKETSGATRVSRHRVTRKEKSRIARTPKSIEALLRETARKGYPDPEDVDNPMITPQDHGIRQSGRVLELQNKDL